MAWYLWLIAGVVIGAAACLALGLWFAADDERAAAERLAVQRQQHVAERQLDHLALEAMRQMFVVARGGSR